MDKVAATPARAERALSWDQAALALLDEAVANEPYITRISAAKRLRDRAEHAAREAGDDMVDAARLSAVIGRAAMAPA